MEIVFGRPTGILNSFTLVFHGANSIFLWNLTINSLAGSGGSFVELYVIQFDFSNVRIRHIFTSFFNIRVDFVLATINIFIIILNIHRTCEGHILHA